MKESDVTYIKSLFFMVLGNLAQGWFGIIWLVLSTIFVIVAIIEMIYENKEDSQYFVSYGHSKGFGNCIVALANGVDAGKVKEKIQNRLEEESVNKGIVILNYIKINE